jgi:hypothetical protein
MSSPSAQLKSLAQNVGAGGKLVVLLALAAFVAVFVASLAASKANWDRSTAEVSALISVAAILVFNSKIMDTIAGTIQRYSGATLGKSVLFTNILHVALFFLLTMAVIALYRRHGARLDDQVDRAGSYVGL